jgi:hypothetical protein
MLQIIRVGGEESRWLHPARWSMALPDAVRASLGGRVGLALQMLREGRHAALLACRQLGAHPDRAGHYLDAVRDVGPQEDWPPLEVARRAVQCFHEAARPLCDLLACAGGNSTAPPLQRAMPLTSQQRSILTVLREARPAALTGEQIVSALDRACRDRSRTDGVHLVSLRTVGKELNVLRKAGLVERPSGTKRKGDAISPDGLQALRPGA